MLFRFRTAASLLTLSAVLALTGCAVQYDKRGRAMYSADLAELFGDVVDTQPLPDSQDPVTLRRMNDQWSLKLGNIARVVALGKLNSGRIVNVSQVGNAINILLEISTPQCARQYRLVSVAARAKANVWPLDIPCSNVVPQVQTGQVEQYIDFVVGSRVSRFVYRDGKFRRNQDVVLPAGMTSLPGPAGSGSAPDAASDDRYLPGPPFSPNATQLRERPERGASFTPATTPLAPTAAPQPAAPAQTVRPRRGTSGSNTNAGPARTPGHIDFGTEIKPTITVDLTK
ncbi:hypothetical protein [Comamonas aquatica]|uniref:hypothetical protein n=1 Tax=Comamonas aquatica TaxID=225991 RepID=UPI002447D990|nr:hypothetical protein [Comamonas aquatica]MDH0200096.1 hypothetical protein [Comamonas aquatica]MDH1446154.1 hypothetical protein [Comamonas aquatica]